MPLYTDEELQELINSKNERANETQGIESVSSTKGLGEPEIADAHNIYYGPNLQLYEGIPPCEEFDSDFNSRKLFFYYMKFNTQGSLEARVYESVSSQDYNETKITNQINAWLDDPNMESISSNPSGILWNQPCYIAFMLDNDGWAFHRSEKFRGQSKKTVIDALHFQSYIDNKFDYKPNNYQCFCNSFEIFTNNNKSVLCVQNRHTRHYDNYPRAYNDEPEDYKFDLFFRVSLSPKFFETVDGVTREKKLTMIIDPTGTNFGPP